MTNYPSQPPQPPEPPEQSSSRNRNIEPDELIAIIVAFGTIGAILFFSLIGNQDKWRFKNWQQWLATSQVSDQNQGDVFDATKSSSAIAPTERVNTPKAKPSHPKELPQNNQLAPASKLPPTRKQKVIVPPVVITPPIERKVVPPNREPIDSTAQPPQTTKPTPPAIIFQDVTSDYWASPFIYKLQEQGLISGLSDRNFQPEQPITRAGMAELISEAFNQPAATGTKQFKDVTPDTEAATKINEAVGRGFMKGYSDGEFRPQEEISRYQVLVTLATGLNLQPSQDSATILQSFNDADQLPKWSLNQVAAAIESGLLVNPPAVAQRSLQPNQTATRAEVAAMIYQALVKSGKLPPISSQYIVPAQ